MAGGWSVLPRPGRKGRGVGPYGLNAFTVSHPNAVHIHEVELCLTLRPMAYDMKLGDRDTERVEGIDIDGRHERTT